MPAGDTPTFSLERFAWDAPDRLQLAGVFSGMGDIPAGEPVLAVQGPDGMRRLPAIGPGGESPAANGGRWSAAFAWLEAPVAFDRARLELGADVAVELPAPGDDAAGGSLPVEAAAPPQPPTPDVKGAADRLRREAALLEETLAAAAAAREETEQRAQATIAALQQRVAELEPTSAELASTRAELEETQDALAAARGALAEARSGAQELLDRLSRLADPPAGGR